jgi:hypothetical protein
LSKEIGMQLDFEMQKYAKIRIPDETLTQVLTGIAEAAARNKKLGLAVEEVEVRLPEMVDGPEGGTRLRYSARIRLRQTRAKSPERALQCFRHAFGVLARRAATKGWEVLGEPPGDPASLPATRPPRPPLQLPDLTPEVVGEAFAGVYEREAHVRIIHDAVRTFVATGRRQASHVLLHGEPAAAKSTLFRAFKALYERGSEVERVVFIDAQTMTRAGLEDWLLLRAEEGSLPEIIVLEELEKQGEAVLLPLISVMGSGYLAKTNARVGRRVEHMPLLVFGTCNNAKRLRAFHDEALWSRFTHKLECRRPGRALMKEILVREVAERGGSAAWVEPALALGYEVLKTDDPRELIGLLDGGDRLLTGEYQRDYVSVRTGEAWRVAPEAERGKAAA